MTYSLASKAREISDLFWSKVDKQDECWIWIAAINMFGYGHFAIERKIYKAHRVAYMIKHGDIPDGMYILHSCDNPACVNPEHLRVGTQKDNIMDRTIRGRHNPTSGTKNAWAKLTEKDVLQIRGSNLSALELSELYGISRSNIYNILGRRTWTHI